MIHEDVRPAIHLPHSAFAHLLINAIFVFQNETDESITLINSDKSLPVEWAEQQLVSHLSLADGALLHPDLSDLVRRG